MPFTAWDLKWAQVDPERREFDPAGVAAVVCGLEPAGRKPAPGTDWRLVSAWCDELTTALAAHYGAWAVGWEVASIAIEDETGRGRVPVWRYRDTKDMSLDAIAAALVAWHELVVELTTDPSGRFAEFPIEPAGAVPLAWQVAMSRGRIGKYPPQPPTEPPLPWMLSWAQMDPTGLPFDPRAVPDVVRELRPAREDPGSDASWAVKSVWMDAMTFALIGYYGTWACGWAGGAGVNGGVVGSWCCNRCSIKGPQETLAAVAASVIEWHDHLADLAERFSRFLPIGPDLPDDYAMDRWERATVSIVTAVGDRTGYCGGWQGAVFAALQWFLGAAGVPVERHQALVDDAVGGRFKSWVTPSRMDVLEVAETFAGRMVRDRT